MIIGGKSKRMVEFNFTQDGEITAGYSCIDVTAIINFIFIIITITIAIIVSVVIVIDVIVLNFIINVIFIINVTSDFTTITVNVHLKGFSYFL